MNPVKAINPTHWQTRFRLTGHAASGGGHQRMLKLLREIRDRSPTENLYIGPAFHARERKQLEMLPADAPAAHRGRLHLFVGKDELRLGNNQRAVEHLLKAYELSDKSLVQPAFQLAVAHLRLGETQNCLAHRNAESCILPIRGGGVHQDQSGAREAIKYFKVVLDRQPKHIAARWLLNLAFMTVGEYPEKVPPKFLVPPERFESEQEFPRFRGIAPEAGTEYGWSQRGSHRRRL